MPLNGQKITRIIIDECEVIEERYEGYKDDLLELVTDIIAAERDHRVQGTNIQQKITDSCYAAADILTKNLNQTSTTRENTQ